MELINIDRKYNKYIFAFDNGKLASVDVESKEYIGVTGKTVKTIPTSIPDNFKGLLRDMMYYGFDRCGKIYVDRIISMTDISITTKINFSLIVSKFWYDSNWYTENWKTIIKIIRDCDKSHNYPLGHEFYNIIMRERIKDIIVKYNLESIADYIDPNYPNFLHIKAFRSAIRHLAINPYIKAQEAVKNMLNCDDERIIAERYGIKFTKYNVKSEINKLYTKMQQITEYLKYMNINDYQFSNIERDYNDIKTMYETNKTEIDNRKFSENQTKYNLEYSDENYHVFVPTSRSDLANIGRSFNNCANSWEWQHRLSYGKYLLVVIRDNKTNFNRVCCDIETETLKIDQYKGKNNYNIHDESLKEFKQKYQNYLNTIKGE